ncbi:MAG: hypothetical protein ACTSWW_04595 [Promethearchaeota archaeon]
MSKSQRISEYDLFSSKRLLSMALVCGGGVLLTLLVQWASLVILLYPVITGAGMIVFGIIAEKKNQTTLSEAKITLYPLGNEEKNFRLLLISLCGQFLLIVFWGWDAQNNPHLMDNYGMLFYLPIWLLFIIGWSGIGILWRVPNITLFTHEYHEKQAPWKKKLFHILIAVDCVLLVLSIAETLAMMYSTSYSGIWQLEIILPEANGFVSPSIPNYIYISGFSYYLGWSQFLGITIYLILRFRDTKKMARILKDQLKIKYPQEQSSVIMLSEKILDQFTHTKFL